MRVIYECTPWSPSGSVVEYRSAESEGLRFVSSNGHIIFSFSHARDQTKNIFLLYDPFFQLVFKDKLKLYHLNN